MKYSIQLSQLAIDDLIALHRWVTVQAGWHIADGYLSRINARIDTLSEFPDRGTPREDFGPDVRTISFERRLLVAYSVVGGTVRVIRVINAQRELGALFSE